MVRLFPSLQRNLGIYTQTEKLVSYVRGCYDWAKFQGKIDSNPIEGMSKHLDDHVSGNMDFVSIEEVSLEQFISGSTTGFNIYVSCEGKFAVGSDEAADFAESMIGKSRDYNALIDNCHQFIAGCLIGNSENPNNFL